VNNIKGSLALGEGANVFSLNGRYRLEFPVPPWVPPDPQRPSGRQLTDAAWGSEEKDGKRLHSLNLLESLRGLEDRLGCLPRLGDGLEERPLPWMLLEWPLGFKTTRLLRRLVFYGWGEETVVGFFIVWSCEARSEGRVGRGFVAV